jgi:N-acetylmuramoyl-L-alanine amidase
VVGKRYGCTNNCDNPTTTEAYSGAWVRDASDDTLRVADASTADGSPGVVVIRKPPFPGKMGYVAISDGNGEETRDRSRFR